MNIINFFLTSCHSDSAATDTCQIILNIASKAGRGRMHGACIRITEEICHSLVWIFAICVVGFLLWKVIDHIAYWLTEKRKQEYEKYVSQQKHEKDLKDKLLTFLEKATNEERETNLGKTVQIQKASDSSECKTYKETLEELIRTGCLPDPPKLNK